MNADLVPLVIADIYELAGAFRRRGEEIARDVGQTQARWQVLSAASDVAKTVPQVAGILGVSRQNVQRIANALVRDRLARFVHNPDHRSSPHLVLSGKGRGILANLTRVARSRHRGLATRLKGIDLAALRRDLRQMQLALDTKFPPSLKEYRHDDPQGRSGPL
jgi:DNA-binding MarR family transcriptional regulator